MSKPLWDDWQTLIKPGITAIVGAGGKTSLLKKLVTVGVEVGMPVVATTTTKMHIDQVKEWTPLFDDDFSKSHSYCINEIENKGYAAWFSGIGKEKALGVDPKQLDRLSMLHDQWMIITEADGAKEKWLKAPKTTEPVIPDSTRTTIGILNMNVLGKPVSEQYIHNLELACRIMEVEDGDILTESCLVKLITHEQGLFQYAQGDKVLFCTGCHTIDEADLEDFVSELRLANAKQPVEQEANVDKNDGVTKIYLVDGYETEFSIRRIIICR